MPWLEFEPTIPPFERAKTVHASDRATTVTGIPLIYLRKFSEGQYYFVLKVCGDGILIRLLWFWTLSIVVFLFKTYSISNTKFCLRLQVENAQLGTYDRANPYLRPQLGRFRLKNEIESSLRNMFYIKNKIMNNGKKHNSYINLSCLCFIFDNILLKF
jgi:hypothetical protein